VNVIFRVDASVAMGIGHVMRCRCLAAALQEAGHRVHFVCRAHPGSQISALREEGFAVTALAPSAAPIAHIAPQQRHAHSWAQRGHSCVPWLNTPAELDAAETAAAIAEACGGHADWLVVDHYGIDATWERVLQSFVRHILVIDDLADRTHLCDLLVDQNHHPNADTRYRSLVPAHTQILLGPRYALLRPEYIEHRLSLRDRDGRIRRALVFFGGTDPQNLSCATLQAFLHPSLSGIDLDIVVGANNGQRATLQALLAENRRAATVHQNLPHLADLMAAADLSVGGGGITTWERCCLGLPSIVVSLAENQRPGCETLSRDGIIHYLGSASEARAGLSVP
jgi:UDP-2,4-diacetamido-2,4,6-trideoxy-beta-L-altropyranose hydrolase